MENVQHSVVHCSGDLSCTNLQFKHESGDTLVRCSAKEACKDAWFYEYGQLDIQCSAYMSCAKANVKCYSGSGIACMDPKPPPFYTYTKSSPTGPFVLDCSDFTNGCAYDPTPSPTSSPTAKTQLPTFNPTNNPTPKPTHNPTKRPTHEPSKDPSANPSLNPTAKPTTDPTIEPTVDPTHNPTIQPTVDPTNVPTIRPTVDPTRTPTVDTLDSTLLICGSILLVACIIVVIVLVSKPNKRTQPQLTANLLSQSLRSLSELGAPKLHAMVPGVSATFSEMEDETEAISIQHAMVILIAIGEYDDIKDNPNDADEELSALGGLNNLDGIEKDIQNLHKLFGPKYLNYTIYPEYNLNEALKVYWTQDEIIDFLNEKATYLENHLDEFDGLIVVISGHGMKGFICT
eukprot:34365_1